MTVRKATPADLQAIKEIYTSAVRFMRSTGNVNQWTGGYPDEAVIKADTEAGHLHVCEESGEILAVFYYRFGDDPTYALIVDGEWPSDEPYGVIHRIAVSDKARGKGISRVCFDSAHSQSRNVRIDTHRDNLPMQRALEKYGFKRCGIIFLENGDERIAFASLRGDAATR